MPQTPPREPLGSRSEPVSQRMEREVGSAKEAASMAGRDLKQGATDLANDVREKAADAAEEQKDSLNSLVRDISQAVSAAADELGARNQSAAAHYANAIGSGLAQFSGTLENKSVDGMIADVSRFAREHPAAYIGGSLLIGMALARFAVASPPQSSPETSAPAEPRGHAGAQGPSAGPPDASSTVPPASTPSNEVIR